MLQPLAKKRVLLGITGGIAAYKSADLVRRLREAGAEVQVAMTPAATAFVAPLTFQAVSGQPAHIELLDTHAEAGMGHIDLARWADLILIAPATADFLARLAHGMANDLLSTLCLATDQPIAVAPAMNRLMWQNVATQDNCRLLARRGIKIWGPGVGEQPCGEIGAGRMLEPVELCNLVIAQLGTQNDTAEFRPELPVATSPSTTPLTPHDLQGLTVLLTAGPTREALDPVRFISNRSTGKMGFAVAEAAAAAGARVLLVSGPVALKTPPGVERIDVESAVEMHEAVMERACQADLFIATAAVADRHRRCRRLPRRQSRRAENQENSRRPDFGVSAQSRYPGGSGRTASAPAVYSGFRRRNARCFAIRRGQATPQESRHDRRQSGRRGRQRLRKRTERIARPLGRWGTGVAAGGQNTAGATTRRADRGAVPVVEERTVAIKPPARSGETRIMRHPDRAPDIQIPRRKSQALLDAFRFSLR